MGTCCASNSNEPPHAQDFKSGGPAEFTPLDKMRQSIKFNESAIIDKRSLSISEEDDDSEERLEEAIQE